MIPDSGFNICLFQASFALGTHIPLGKSVRGRSTDKEGSNTWSILMSAGVMGGRPGVNPLSWAATGSREQSLHYTLRLLGTTG